MWEGGKTIEEIAKLRSMALGTITGHMAKWVEEEKVEIEKVISENKLNQLVAILTKDIDTPISQIISKVNEKVEYADVKMVKWYLNKHK